MTVGATTANGSDLEKQEPTKIGQKSLDDQLDALSAAETVAREALRAMAADERQSICERFGAETRALIASQAGVVRQIYRAKLAGISLTQRRETIASLRSIIEEERDAMIASMRARVQAEQSARQEDELRRAAAVRAGETRVLAEGFARRRQDVRRLYGHFGNRGVRHAFRRAAHQVTKRQSNRVARKPMRPAARRLRLKDIGKHR